MTSCAFALVRTRTGLIKLLNGFLRIRVRVKTITQMVRVALGFTATAELPHWYQKVWVRFGLLMRLWWLIAVNYFALSMPVGRFFGVLQWTLYSKRLPEWGNNGVEAAAIIFNRWAFWRGLKHAACCCLGLEILLVVLMAPFLIIGILLADLSYVAFQWEWAAVINSLSWKVFIVMMNVAFVTAVAVSYGMEHFRRSLGLLWRCLKYAACCCLGLVVLMLQSFIDGIFLTDPSYAASQWKWGTVINSQSWTVFGVMELVAIATAVVIGLLLIGSPIQRFLRHYRLHSDLGDSYALKEALVKVFDPNYYGKFAFDRVLDRGLNRGKPDEAHVDASGKKKLASYQNETPSIRVVPLAANIETGQMEALRPPWWML